MEIVWDEDFVIWELDSMVLRDCGIRVYGEWEGFIDGDLGFTDLLTSLAWCAGRVMGIVIFMVGWHCGIF